VIDIGYGVKVRVITAPIQRSELINRIFERTDWDSMNETEVKAFQAFAMSAVDLLLWSVPEFFRRPPKQQQQRR
jgi:hypothetical protein